MGMPGSKTALEEMMSRVLGDLIQEGCVTKLADDLYCGGDSPETLLSNWRRVLQCLDRCNLRLSATKTIVCPKSTTILGWIWSQGTLAASPHRIAILSSCPPPQSVKGLCFFIGPCKILSHVLPNCSDVVDPLECALTGLQSNDKLLWDEHLTLKFKSAQEHLSRHKSTVLPCPSDTLWIVTDLLPREVLVLHCMSGMPVIFTQLDSTVASCANTKSPGFPMRLRPYQLLLLSNTSLHSLSSRCIPRLY